MNQHLRRSSLAINFTQNFLVEILSTFLKTRVLILKFKNHVLAQCLRAANAFHRELCSFKDFRQSLIQHLVFGFESSRLAAVYSASLAHIFAVLLCGASAWSALF